MAEEKYARRRIRFWRFLVYLWFWMGIIEVARWNGLGILISKHMLESKIGLLEQIWSQFPFDSFLSSKLLRLPIILKIIQPKSDTQTVVQQHGNCMATAWQQLGNSMATAAQFVQRQFLFLRGKICVQNLAKHFNKDDFWNFSGNSFSCAAKYVCKILQLHGNSMATATQFEWKCESESEKVIVR